MSEPAPLPLVLTTTIPLVLGLLPILLILIALIHPATRSRLTTTSISLPTLSSITKRPATTTKKASKIRPLLLSAQGVANVRKKMVRREDFGMTPRPSMDGDSGGLRGMFGSVTPGQVVEAEVQKAETETENGKEMMVRNLKVTTIMASAAIISGVLYLVFEPKTSSKAVQIALSFSILSLPLTIGCLFLTYLTPSLSALSFPVLSGSIFIPTIALATISAFTSLYLTLALPLIPLLSLSALALYRQSSRPGRIRLSYAEGEKKRGLFSGQTGRILGLGVSTRGREGEMEVMRPDSSWLTESGKSRILFAPQGNFRKLI
jgi:hypothetical protein